MELLTCHKALADHTRLRLFHLLAHHELNVGEILDVLEMGQSRISRHLKILADAGLLTARRHGAWVFYAVNKEPGEGGAAAFVRAMLPLVETIPTAAEDLAAANRVVEERAMASRQFFDAMAPRLPWVQDEMLGKGGGERLAELAKAALPQCEVLGDLGCGAGAMLPALLHIAKRIIGVDSSPRMLAQAKAVLQRAGVDDAAISLRLGDLHHLPLSNEEADCALLSLVLHHLPTPQEGLAETWRVLRPGGCCVVIDFVRHERETMRRQYGDRWLGFTQEELAAWCAAAGFTVTTFATHPLPNGLGLLCLTAHKP